MKLIDVENLTLQFDTDEGRITAVDNVSFSLEAGEVMGLVGESGSGKSMTGRAILRLVRHPGRQQADVMRFDGIDLQGQSERQMRHLRGARISMIMQDPKFSLNPVMTVGAQIAEAAGAVVFTTYAGRGLCAEDAPLNFGGTLGRGGIFIRHVDG